MPLYPARNGLVVIYNHRTVMMVVMMIVMVAMMHHHDFIRHRLRRERHHRCSGQYQQTNKSSHCYRPPELIGARQIPDGKLLCGECRAVTLHGWPDALDLRKQFLGMDRF